MSSYLKGLGERISSKEEFTKEINIDKLIPSNKNFYRINEIDELANSIKESGLMHNLVVREIKENQGFYEILSGERRYMALKSLNYKMVPCRVIKMNDFDAEIALINANAKTRELTHIEKMEGIKRLKEIYTLKKSNGEAPKGKTRDLIGNDIGMSGVQVGRYMKVAEKLSDEFKEMLNKDEITLTQAIDLSNLSKDEQHDIYVNIRGASKDEAKILIEGIKQPVNKEDEELIPKGKVHIDNKGPDNKLIKETTIEDNSSNENIKLRKCPFCGQEMELLRCLKRVCDTEYFIQCYQCGARSRTGITGEEVVKAWNRRI